MCNGMTCEHLLVCNPPFLILCIALFAVAEWWLLLDDLSCSSYTYIFIGHVIKRFRSICVCNKL